MSIRAFKIILLLTLCLGLFANAHIAQAADAAKKSSKAAPKKPAATSSVSEEQEARLKLQEIAQKHTATAAKFIRPGKDSRHVEKRGDVFVSSYRELDASNITTDMSEQNMPGSKFVGSLVYVVNDFECKGATADAAMRSNDCQKVKSQRMREMTRYDKGKWYM